MFFNSISAYSEYNIDYGDLSYAELTFTRYERITGYKSSDRYRIYVKEHEKPFEINSITNKRLDIETLEEMRTNQKIKVYYCESNLPECDYEICEISSDADMLLSLSDYVKTNQNNQVAGMIVCPILVLLGLALISLCIWGMKIANAKPSKSNLGKVKLECTIDGNVIRVYNSVAMCSLVINDKVADRDYGLIGSNFVLCGKVKKDGKRIPVTAKMGNKMNEGMLMPYEKLLKEMEAEDAETK